ncbi:MAG TPA: hypothetical protein VFP50_08275, partial [Anaeromyxobacteraceae bacterium]|nr:hypothetical protein [Anaeromyxobacteraceae bacterium]
EGPMAVGRDLAPAPLVAPVRTGRATPLVAWAGPALLTGGPGLVAARLEPTSPSRPGARGAGVVATLFLDDAAERPFATYPRCLAALPPTAGARGYAELEKKRAWTEAPRAAGDEDRLEATLVPLAPRGLGPPGAGPLVVERWPRGARAAVVFTDHADRTDPDALRAVLYGHSDPRAEGGRGAGLLGRGLAFTRSFFVRPGRGTLEDPETARLAARLVAEGAEVALHSVSDARDDRPAVASGLAEAAPFAPATWIDHEPYVNCEALSAEGAGLAPPYGVRDLLLAGGIRWGWAAGDVAGFRSVEVADLFAAAPPGSPSPAFYPLADDPRLWIFQSSFFYEPPAALAGALSDAALDRLERGRGLFVAHTYLGAGPAETRGRFAATRLCVRPAAGGGLEIDPDLDEALARLAARVARGSLLALPWAEVGDRLRALAEVEVRYREDGAAEVVNHGAVALPGLTLATGRPGLEWWVDGRRADGEADGARIWFDLPARSSRVVRASRWFWPVPLLPAATGSP